MKTLEKIEKKGYKVTCNLGTKKGEKIVLSIRAKKGELKFEAKTVSSLLKKIKK
jgi:hypothetical protein